MRLKPAWTLLRVSLKKFCSWNSINARPTQTVQPWLKVAIVLMMSCLFTSANAQTPPLVIPSDTSPPAIADHPPAEQKSSVQPPVEQKSSVQQNNPLDSKATEPQKLTPAATQFIKGLTLIVLPLTFTDDDDWGNTKRIQSGLNVELDGLELKTSRRWKDAKHGLWRKVDATFVDPEKFFDLQIWLLPKTNDNQPRYRVTASLRIAATARQQQWNRGLKIYSISSEILTDISVDAVIDFRSKLLEVDTKTRLQILPHVQSADVRIDRFSVRRISHAKGNVVREFGNALEGLVRKVVQKKSKKLPQKINTKIEKKADRFQISGPLLSVFGLQAKTEKEAKAEKETKTEPK